MHLKEHTKDIIDYVGGDNWTLDLKLVMGRPWPLYGYCSTSRADLAYIFDL